MKIGILALQGASQAHKKAFARLGVESFFVKTPEQMKNTERLVMPGGESTTISRMLEFNGLSPLLSKKIESGTPIFGTCAGMILLAKEILDKKEGQTCFGAAAITVRRNAYGRQKDSFEQDISIPILGEKPFPGVFIRSPQIVDYGEEVEVLSKLNKTPILCKQQNVLLASFHPELTDDLRLHEYFMSM